MLGSHFQQVSKKTEKPRHRSSRRWREKCASSRRFFSPSLPFSFGCHSSGWRPRLTLRVRTQPQLGHRRCCRWGHQRASPSIRGRASTKDTASGGMSCRIALCSVRTSRGICGYLSPTNAGNPLVKARSFCQLHNSLGGGNARKPERSWCLYCLRRHQLRTRRSWSCATIHAGPTGGQAESSKPKSSSAT
jgi:hypothetical protein